MLNNQKHLDIVKIIISTTFFRFSRKDNSVV